ncbi:hypothetical protein Btru_032375 [Bulinus truncatus]|nr:hypothetical protein Btru_032375 [Bulinus truncatus]
MVKKPGALSYSQGIPEQLLDFSIINAAIQLDKINIKAYTLWSLMDNFEWSSGYTVKMGCYQVNFSDPTRTRTPKSSARYLFELFRANGFIEGSATDPKTREGFSYDNSLYYGQFPRDFSFGVSSAGFDEQSIVSDDGNRLSSWGLITNISSPMHTVVDASMAFSQDIAALTHIKAGHYYFAITWSRLFPSGKLGGLSQTGINYYLTLIDQLLDAGITPAIAINQWDYPVALHINNGWLNDSMIDEYINLAETCFDFFGSKVKYWVTFSLPENIPETMSITPLSDYYKIYRNVLLAHAKVYQLYTLKYKAHQKGQLGISLAPILGQPINPKDPSHAASAYAVTDYSFGLFADPIYFNGDFSSKVKQIAGSYLIQFSEAEKQLIKGSADFFGLEYYNILDVGRNVDVAKQSILKFPVVGSNPKALRTLLRLVHKRYGSIPIIVTGNGLGDTTNDISDNLRSSFVIEHIDEILKAINIDGVLVKAYTYRSLSDSYEWGSGYKLSFGLVQVNFSGTNEHSFRTSSATFKKISEDHGILKPSH